VLRQLKLFQTSSGALLTLFWMARGLYTARQSWAVGSLALVTRAYGAGAA
jgi:hypothetical protein